MQTQTFVQASAKITRVTELAPGDCYKRLEAGSYGGEDSMIYGVITDVLNNGDNVAIQSMEFTLSTWNEITAKAKVFRGDRDVAIFPASPDDVQRYFKEAVESQEKKVLEAEQKVITERQKLAEVAAFVGGTLAAQSLRTAPSTDAPALEAQSTEVTDAEEI